LWNSNGNMTSPPRRKAPSYPERHRTKVPYRNLPGALSNFKRGLYEKQKKLRYDFNPDPYAKRTASRVVATAAPQSDRVGSRTWTLPFRELLARAPRRGCWSAIPARFWKNCPAAHLNLLATQYGYGPRNPHLLGPAAKDSRRPADPTSRLDPAGWRVSTV
jgi:hypothetical protein